MITETELIRLIQPALGHQLDPNQMNVIDHGAGPCWVVAGPGSGKTEVLVIRVLRLIFVDSVDPRSIVITTFTNKAAKSLFDRILSYANLIFSSHPDLQSQVNIHLLRVGTLHSICNDVMQEYRYPDYENYRLIDDSEQFLFIYEHSVLSTDNTNRFMPLWKQFQYLFDGYDSVFGTRGWSGQNIPNRWRRTKAAMALFNRIVEDKLDLGMMSKAGGAFQLLSVAYTDYETLLATHRRCDFAHIQKKFLAFLGSPFGQLFLNGNGTPHHPGIKHVLVDEYQDTNPIQEEIYFKLAHRRNLCVVGDDDQALYRFRGGTVDCMVNFDAACTRYWRTPLNSVAPTWLNTNYRSHTNIIRFFDSYIRSFSEMQLPGARVQQKPRLQWGGAIRGNYPAVGYITDNTIPLTAERFADFVSDLLSHSIITSPSQCVLLMKSVRETSRWAGPFADALRNKNITPYNPRAKAFLEQPDVMFTLGAFIELIDPGQTALAAINAPGIQSLVQGWLGEYTQQIGQHPRLQNYIALSQAKISQTLASTFLGVNILDIFYHMTSYEPFTLWENQPEAAYRLAQISKLFEIYSSIPNQNRPGSGRGDLLTSSTPGGGVSFNWRKSFYYALIGLLASSGLDDPEDEEGLVPPGTLPIMTIHQAKGLQFPFVFVYNMTWEPRADGAVQLETDTAPFRTHGLQLRFTPDQRSKQDLIRLYYVAYSRAQHSLIHLIPKAHRQDGYGYPGKRYTIYRGSSRDVGV